MTGICGPIPKSGDCSTKGPPHITCLQCHSAVDERAAACSRCADRLGATLAMRSGVATGLVVTGSAEEKTGRHGITGDINDCWKIGEQLLLYGNHDLIFTQMLGRFYLSLVLRKGTLGYSAVKNDSTMPGRILPEASTCSTDVVPTCCSSMPGRPRMNFPDDGVQIVG